MSHRRNRWDGGALFFVAFAGLLASFLLGGEEAAVPLRSGGEATAASLADRAAVAQEQRDCDEIRRMDSTGVESVFRRSVPDDVPVVGNAEALVVEPGDAAWFDWEFESQQRPRPIRRGIGDEERSRRRGRAVRSVTDR